MQLRFPVTLKSPSRPPLQKGEALLGYALPLFHKEGRGEIYVPRVLRPCRGMQDCGEYSATKRLPILDVRALPVNKDALVRGFFR